MGGRACIRGLRIPVSMIVGQIAHGVTFEEILEGYPDLEIDDIQQAVEYAAWLTQEETLPLGTRKCDFWLICAWTYAWRVGLKSQGHDSTYLRDAERANGFNSTGEGNGLESGKEENTSSNTTRSP